MFAAHACDVPDHDRPKSSSSIQTESDTASTTFWGTSGSGTGQRSTEGGGTAPVLVSSWAVKKTRQRKSRRMFACFTAPSCSDDMARAHDDVSGLRTGSIFLDDGPERPTRKEEQIMSTSRICDNVLFENDKNQ
eukprot:jgi/Ulvmu1/10083/UM006_0030.1